INRDATAPTAALARAAACNFFGDDVGLSAPNARRPGMSRTRAEKWQSLREVTALIWVGATRFVKVRLALALLIVVATSIVTALAPVALKLVLDALTRQTQGAAVPLGLLLVLYVVSHWIAR